MFYSVFHTVVASEFYLWQRRWTPEVSSALKTAGQSPRTVFAAELTRDGWERSALPPEQFAPASVTTALRVRVEAFDAETAQKLIREIQTRRCRRVEIDADVPTRRLGEYAALLKTLRSALAGQLETLSITVLPDHLRSDDFGALLRHVDFYVLQLHGIEPPKNLQSPYALIDRQMARSAIASARRWKHPFKLALPAYAYELIFDRETGKFLRLRAENGAPLPANAVRKTAEPDWELVAELIRQNPELPVIWFRLPVPGDRLNLDHASIARLERGEPLTPTWSLELEPTGKRAFDLYLTLSGCLRAEPVCLTLQWPRDATGEFEPASGVATPEALAFGQLPETVEIPFPGCGVRFRAGSFLTETHPVIKEIRL